MRIFCFGVEVLESLYFFLKEYFGLFIEVNKVTWSENWVIVCWKLSLEDVFMSGF